MIHSALQEHGAILAQVIQLCSSDISMFLISLASKELWLWGYCLQ